MKNFVFTFLFLFIGLSLKAQICFEVCNNANSEFQLFQKNETGNLICQEGGKSVIISLDGSNSAIRKILDSKDGGLLTKAEIERTLNLTSIFSENNISVLIIESIDKFGDYRVHCQFKGRKGYLIYSVLSNLEN